LAVGDDDLPEERRYKLVVTVADVTTRQLVRLPWDYRRVYGLDPDDQPVADAVRASMAIPFVFRPATVTSRTGLRSTLVDGGLLSNFPIDSLDRTDGKDPRWPTFGITVMPSRSAGDRAINPMLRLLQLIGAPPLLEGVVATTLFGRDHAYLNQPWVAARTVEVDAGDVGLLDFDLSKHDTEALYAKGYGAAQEFLSRWDWADYLKQFRR
jgi:NTE family protein